MNGPVHRMPLIGERAPAFTADSTQGPIHLPDDYRDKWVVFFSHPADFTPVCTDYRCLDWFLCLKRYPGKQPA